MSIGFDYKMNGSPSNMELHPVVNGWNAIQMAGIPFKMDGTPSILNRHDSIQNGRNSSKTAGVTPNKSGEIPPRQSDAYRIACKIGEQTWTNLEFNMDGTPSKWMELHPNCTRVGGLTTTGSRYGNMHWSTLSHSCLFCADITISTNFAACTAQKPEGKKSVSLRS